MGDLENMEGVFAYICDNEKKLPLKNAEAYYCDYVGTTPDVASEWYLRGMSYAL
jgi:hypothetical protein